MKEIGGYIELDQHTGDIYHDRAVALNCGRAALEYLIQAKNIKKLYSPFFCCDSILQPCQRCGIEHEYYHIGSDFRPIFDRELDFGQWLYIVNYYGQLTNTELENYRKKYKRVIVDNAQAYFQMPLLGVDTIYTCRKFFGVSDGAFLYTDEKLSGLEQDKSFERVHYILGRYERTASEFYAESAQNNESFQLEPLKRMSKLTDNLLRCIDYSKVKQCRTENFSYLHTQLNERNKLKLAIPDGAFMYPLYVDNGSQVRKALQSKKIYVPMLWPDVIENCNPDSLEYQYAENILPLPIDQRYSVHDMDYLTKVVLESIG